ncbi:MAG: hypothetical protein AAGJ93_05480 [Bacteroidota bacterium]
MKKKRKSVPREERKAYVSILTFFALVIVCLIVAFLKPQSVTDFQATNHNYARGVITKVNYPMGKSGRRHKYQFEVYGLKYEGSVGYLEIYAEVGDSCTIIYSTDNPERNAIYVMDKSIKKPYLDTISGYAE